MNTDLKHKINLKVKWNILKTFAKLMILISRLQTVQSKKYNNTNNTNKAHDYNCGVDCRANM